MVDGLLFVNSERLPASAMLCLQYLAIYDYWTAICSSIFYTGEGDITRKSVEPIKVFSEKDLIKEIGKATSTLQPDNDWSIRITAMQRVEGIVLGGCQYLLVYVDFTMHIIYIFKLNTLVRERAFLRAFYFFCITGAADYSAFPVLLRQLVTPLINQLLDRRSTVVKQVCLFPFVCM
jgi:CLIP-associating protein 1/2